MDFLEPVAFMSELVLYAGLRLRQMFLKQSATRQTVITIYFTLSNWLRPERTAFAGAASPLSISR